MALTLREQVSKLEQENDRLRGDVLRREKRIEELELQNHDLIGEIREQDREWARRYRDLSSGATQEQDNMSALQGAIPVGDEEEPPVEDAVNQSRLAEFLGWMNGGGYDEDKVHWAKDYMNQSGEEEEESDAEA